MGSITEAVNGAKNGQGLNGSIVVEGGSSAAVIRNIAGTIGKIGGWANCVTVNIRDFDASGVKVFGNETSPTDITETVKDVNLIGAKEAAARIGDVFYKTFESAVAAAKPYDKIVLMKDHSGASLTVDNLPYVTLDLNGYTFELTATDASAISLGAMAKTEIHLRNGTVKVANATILQKLGTPNQANHQSAVHYNDTVKVYVSGQLYTAA